MLHFAFRWKLSIFYWVTVLTLLKVGVVRLRVFDSHRSAEERTDILVRGSLILTAFCLLTSQGCTIFILKYGVPGCQFVDPRPQPPIQNSSCIPVTPWKKGPKPPPQWWACCMFHSWNPLFNITCTRARAVPSRYCFWKRLFVCLSLCRSLHKNRLTNIMIWNWYNSVEIRVMVMTL